jgi:hypothetical protein
LNRIVQIVHQFHIFIRIFHCHQCSDLNHDVVDTERHPDRPLNLTRVIDRHPDQHLHILEPLNCFWGNVNDVPCLINLVNELHNAVWFAVFTHDLANHKVFDFGRCGLIINVDHEISFFVGAIRHINLTFLS